MQPPPSQAGRGPRTDKLSVPVAPEEALSGLREGCVEEMGQVAPHRLTQPQTPGWGGGAGRPATCWALLIPAMWHPGQGTGSLGHGHPGRGLPGCGHWEVGPGLWTPALVHLMSTSWSRHHRGFVGGVSPGLRLLT